MDDAERLSGTTGPDDDSPAPPAGHTRRPYESPRLIRYGHVKQLTAGTKAGLHDISLNSSLS